MPALSQPPRLLIGLSGNLHRAKPTVLRGMPFGGQTWIHRGEVVNAFDDMSLLTMGTSNSPAPISDYSLPFMPARSFPPDLSVGSGSHLRR